MSPIYDCMDKLSTKSDQELFYIYRGSQNPRPITERYLAARILESRDFRFKDIHAYITKWEKEKYKKTLPNGRFKYRVQLNQSDLITLLMFLAIIFLGIVVIVPVFFPIVSWYLPLVKMFGFFSICLAFWFSFIFLGSLVILLEPLKILESKERCLKSFIGRPLDSIRLT